MRRKPIRAGAMLALLCGFVLRAWFVVHHPRFAGDTLVYGDLAQNLLRHGVYGLTEEGIRPTLIRLPGYPLFLALCFRCFGMGQLLPVLWVQVVVDLLGCWLLGDLARRLFGERVALAAVWLSALCPFTANYTAAALTETLSIFCVTLTLWGLSLWRARGGAWWAGLIGLAVMFAAVSRPDGGLLAVAVVPAMVWAGWERRAEYDGVGRAETGLGRAGIGVERAGVRVGAEQEQTQIPFGNDKPKEQIPFGDDGPKEQVPLGSDGPGTQIPFGDDNQGGQGRSAAEGRWRALRDAALVVAVLCGALGVWAVRNWRVFHVVEPLAPKYANDPGEAAPLGFARWYRTWGVGFGDTVRVYWAWDGSVERMSDLPSRAFYGPEERAETAAIYARYNTVTSSTPAFEAELAALAVRRVREHPVRFYVLLPLVRMADMWLRPRTELMRLPLDWLRVGVHPGQSAFEIAYAALDWLLLGLAGAGFSRLRGRLGVVIGAGVAFVVLRSLLLMTIDNSEPRYTLECFPVVLALAAFALYRSPQGCDHARTAGSLRG